MKLQNNDQFNARKYYLRLSEKMNALKKPVSKQKAVDSLNMRIGYTKNKTMGIYSFFLRITLNQNTLVYDA